MVQYIDMFWDQLCNNYCYFFEGIVLICEKVGIWMVVYFDDFVWGIFGILCIVYSDFDLQRIVDLVNFLVNLLCVCVGLLGLNFDNDVLVIFVKYGDMGWVVVVYVRNVKFLGLKKFKEVLYFFSDGFFDMYVIMKFIYDYCLNFYICFDYGWMIWGEMGCFGYLLYDCVLGIIYFNGLWEVIEKVFVY